jgi:diguanylate cyclase (GGDEF)-like protein
MRLPDPRPLRSMLNEIASTYNHSTVDASKLRAAHIASILRLTPAMMTANVCSGLLVVWTFAPDISLGMSLWLLALCITCALAMRNWWQHRNRPPRAQVSSRGAHRATLRAAVLAGIWGLMPLIWFPGASADQRLTISSLVAGMIAAGSFVLSPLPYASLVWAMLFAGGSFAALVQIGSAAAWITAILLVLYTVMIMMGSLLNWQKEIALLRARAQSEQQEHTLSILLQDFEQNAGDALWETDAQGRLKLLSPRLRELLLLPAQGDVCDALQEVLFARGLPRDSALNTLLSAGKPFKDFVVSLKSGQDTVHRRLNGKPLESETGVFLGWRGVISDVTEKVNSENMLRVLAHTDSLTGLANRFTLRDSMARMLSEELPISLFAIDLDHFKSVNDMYGHSTGDALLQVIAQRLRECVRAEAIVARMGGDEFAVLLQCPEAESSAPAIAQRIVESLAQAVNLHVRVLRVGGSVGVALRSESALSIDELLIQADIAMYAAKAAGRGQWAVYTPALGEASHRRLALEAGLRQALESDDQLALHWQPKVDLVTGRIRAVEGLLRWNHPQWGEVSPVEFIPLAEQCGLIDALGTWALRQACRAGAQELRALKVCVNVSASQVRDVHFLDTLNEVIRTSGMNPALLELELTESIFMDGEARATEVLHQLRGLGVQLALDDFGTGYSSLSYLLRFPFDTLKIDRSFVHTIGTHTVTAELVNHIIEMGKSLRLVLVAEGVETEAQAHYLRDHGVDLAQGWLYARALPLDELMLHLQDNSAQYPAT